MNKDNAADASAAGVKKCPFCGDKISAAMVAEHGSVYAVKDNSPVSEGHHLVIPFRHAADLFSMTREERADAEELICKLRENLLSADASITGFNVGFNCGADAGQTIFHAHIHVIPRRLGDTPNPRGGVRGVIPAKMSY
jgi:ATP adenylyltransferase